MGWEISEFQKRNFDDSWKMNDSTCSFVHPYSAASDFESPLENFNRIPQPNCQKNREIKTEQLWPKLPGHIQKGTGSSSLMD
jgi:hypothetical protein